MAKQYKTGLIITGDASGGIRAVKATEAELAKLNKGFDSGNKKARGFADGSKSASSEVAALSKSAKAAAAGVAAVSASIAAAGGAVFAFTKNAADNTRSLVNQAQVANTSVAEFQRYAYASKSVRIEQEKLGGILQDVNDRVGEFMATGGGPMADFFENIAPEVRVTAEQFRNLSGPQALQLYYDSLEKANLSQADMTFYLETMASDTTALIPLLRNGGQGFAEMASEADSLGIVLSEMDVANLAEFVAQVDRVSATFSGLSAVAAAQLAPTLSDVADSLVDVAIAFREGKYDKHLDALFNGAQVVATLLAGRFVGAVGASTVSMLAATRQSVAYQMALARMAGVSKTAAASQTALAGASRAAAGALALVGGPAGAAVLAAGAVYYFREELELVKPKVKSTEDYVRELSAGIDTMSESAINNRLDVLRLDLMETSKQAISTAIALSKLEETEVMYGQGMAADQRAGVEQRSAQLENLRNEIDATTATIAEAEARREALIAGREQHTIVTDDETESIIRQNQAYSDVAASLDPAIAKQKAYTETMQALTKELTANNISSEEFQRLKGLAEAKLHDVAKAAGSTGGAFRSLSKSADEAGQSLEEQSASAQGLIDTLYPLQAAQRQYSDDKAALISYAQQEGLGNDWVVQSMIRLNDQYAEGSAVADAFGESAVQATEDAAAGTSDMEKLFENSMDRMDDAAVDMWRNFLDGSENTFDSFKNIALDALAEVIHAFTTRQITASFGINAQGGAAGALGGGSGGLGGLGGLFSVGKSLLTGGLGGISWGGVGTAGYSGGWAGNATSGLGPSGALDMWGGSTSNFGGMTGIASLGAGMAGSKVGALIADSFTDRIANSNYGSMAGGAIGTFFGGPIGAGIGSAIGSIADKLFGSKDTPLRMVPMRADASYSGWDQGIYEQGALGAVGFRDDGTKELVDKWNEGDARTLLKQVAELDGALASLATNASELEAMKTAVAGATEATGNVGNLAGLFTSRYGSAIGALGDDFKAFFDSLQGGLNETLPQAALARESLLLMQDAADILRLQFNDTGAAAYEAAGHLAVMAGGTQNLAALQANYHQAMLTDAEKMEMARSELEAGFGALGASIPATKKGFRELVQAQDLNTQAGRENYVQLMTLVDGFNAFKQATAQIPSALDEITNRFDKLADSARDAISDAETGVLRAWEAFSSQSIEQRIALLELAGDKETLLVEARERELAAIDESLRPTQERIWALQDEAAAQQEAAKAGQAYAQSLASAQDWLGSTLGNISGWIDNQNATGGSPTDNLAASQAQFDAQLKLAQGGDREALQSITQYADRLLAGSEDMFASGPAAQAEREKVLAALEKLPDAVSAEQYIADEIKTALREQTAGITDDLGDVLTNGTPAKIAAELAGSFDALTLGVSEVLTRDQLATVMQGKATDAQLDALMKMVDINGDGVMSGLESVIIKSLPSDTLLGNVLKNQLETTRNKQLTRAQVVSALKPVASGRQISSLIKRVDKNADGIITAEELTAANISSMQTAVVSSLSSSFETLDDNVDGLLTFSELKSGLAGIATNAQIRSMMGAADLNNDDVISKLESVIVAEMPTDTRLGTVLKNQLEATRNKQLTHEQVRNALAPIASKSVINKLIERADKNADGIITQQELSNVRLGGLVAGIGNTLKPMFEGIDTSLDGLIDYGEFGKYFDGMASDAELENIFRLLDANGDGTISAIEAGNASSEGVESNTRSIEERSLDQLASLRGLVQEMTRSTNQFVGLNSTMQSLRESINALGVAQGEAARIERERAAAARRERERIERERKAAEQAAREAAEIARVQAEIRRNETALAGLREQYAGGTGRIAEAAGDVSWSDKNMLFQLIDAATGGDEILSHDELLRIASDIRGMGLDNQRAEAWGVRVAQQLYADSNIARIEALIRKLKGGSGSFDYDASGRLPQFSSGGYTGAGGRYEPAGVVHKEEIVWSQADIARAGGVGVVESMRTMSASAWQAPSNSGADGTLGIRAELPPISLPPLLGGGDVVEVLQDLRHEVAELRKENAKLQSEGNRHAAASVTVQQAGFQRQIAEQQKSNRSLATMSSSTRLEAAR
ncbi:EF-hand domain-containing protein [Halomonas halocynthiae]|uniref:EF-hand domain-containing protein n=1 Tax=Halomonas halocynthiae TaxID=176290 RepID=UPI00042295BE|nr:hypothetical protein [Halomonas halocynthiae]